jgi:mannose-6-phosphate isomerase-like protein (cupin superfamily)
MLISRTEDRTEIVANDGSRLRELLHPDRFDCDLPYSLAVAWVDPGEATLPHRLTGETEVYYIVHGAGTMHVGDETAEVRAGDSVVVPAGSEQWIRCTGDEPLQFLCLVSPPWRAETDVRTD